MGHAGRAKKSSEVILNCTILYSFCPVSAFRARTQAPGAAGSRREPGGPHTAGRDARCRHKVARARCQGKASSGPLRPSDAARSPEVSQIAAERGERSAHDFVSSGEQRGIPLRRWFVQPTASSPSPRSSGSKGRKEARGLKDKTKIPPAKILKSPLPTPEKHRSRGGRWG